MTCVGFGSCDGFCLELDLDLYASRNFNAHQSLDGLLSGVHDVDEALVGAALELLTAVLVLVNCTEVGDDLGLGGQGDGTETFASVRFAASTMVSAALSMS